MTNIETNVVKPEISFMENEIVNLVINNDIESNLDSIIKSIEKFMSDNTGKGKSDSEKDQLYKTSQELWKEYAIKLRDSKYNFHLNSTKHVLLSQSMVHRNLVEIPI